MSKRPGPVLRFVLRAPSALYPRHLGWLLGHRFLLLDHVGRNSGTSHQTVLEVVHYDPATGRAVVMSGWGTTSDWFRNVEQAGQANVTIGRRTLPVVTRILDGAEAATLLAGYERSNRWIWPVVRRVLTHLAGLQYDGTEESRLALLRELPMVEFRPLTPHVAQ
ncbi:MAG: nitroreductase family deazaflavin-dependent oxidoreductase [Acidimicrobiales bacterium]